MSNIEKDEGDTISDSIISFNSRKPYLCSRNSTYHFPHYPYCQPIKADPQHLCMAVVQRIICYLHGTSN